MPIEDVAGAVKELIAAGKVKHFGIRGGRANHSQSTRCAATQRHFSVNIRFGGESQIVPDSEHRPQL